MRSTKALISVPAIQHNLRSIRNASDGRGVIAMVKANAYGHGLDDVAGILEREHVEFLGVAFVDEAIQLREAGVMTPILVLFPNEPREAKLMFDYALTPVICSLEQARTLDKESQAVGRPINGHLYIDTGMHRDGFQLHDLEPAIAELNSLKGLRLTGICTHYATTDEPDSSFASLQAERFHEAIVLCEERGIQFNVIHAANTGAFSQGLMVKTTHVRPGLALFGYQHQPDVLDLRPVMSVVTKVLDIRTLDPGESVSYGRHYVTQEKTRIATLPIGYGDGYLRSLSGKAHCLIKGDRYPIVGKVCMDACLVDIGVADVAVGDDVEMFGQHIDAEEVASWAGTIPYEITTAVSSRVPRLLLG